MSSVDFRRFATARERATGIPVAWRWAGSGYDAASLSRAR